MCSPLTKPPQFGRLKRKTNATMEKKELEELLIKWEGSVPKNSIIQKYGDIDGDKVHLTMTLTDEENLLFIAIKAICKANITDVQKAIDMIEDKKVHSFYLK